MTRLFHQLRTRSRALAHGLWLVLLATWLSAVCPHCLAQANASGADMSGAANVSDMPMHCHGDAPPPAEPMSNSHDCCPQASVCTGGNCAQMTAIESGEPLSALVAEVATPAFIAADFITYAYPSTPPPALSNAHTVAFADCPLYLRHCTFLN